MAWADPMPGGGFRGGYRDSAGKKCYVKDERGKTLRFDRKSDAKLAAQDSEVAARRRGATPRAVVAARMPWRQWWEIQHAKKADRDSDTYANEGRIASRFLIPRWGDVPLNQILRDDIQAWVDDEIKPGRAPTYVRRIYRVFAWSMNLAVEKGPLDSSPCAKIKLPKLRKRAKPYMEETHVHALRGHLHETYLDLMQFGIETGLRPGELCGLHAHRLDLDDGWVVVSDVYVEGRRQIRPFPKDGDARVVPLTAKAIEIARRHLEGRNLRAGCGLDHVDGKACNSVTLFVGPRTKEPINPKSYAQIVRAAAIRADVPNLSPYSTRRGFATWAARGVDAFELAELMGHADVDETRGYVQSTPEARGRLLAARGDRTRLRVLPGRAGAAGADAGAHPGRTTQDEADSDPAENVG